MLGAGMGIAVPLNVNAADTRTMWVQIVPVMPKMGRAFGRA